MILFTCGLQVVAFMGMFVEKEVVACRIFRDSQWQVLYLCWLSAAQANQLLFEVYLLLTERIKKLLSGLLVCSCNLESPCLGFHTN